ncbi:Hypothetical protein R9X50_00072700 [Acrodontium crateriforme]|uniref:DUF7729 domain-containing protein n=1 Tax=Acrodontium crateriforme TaxID=150365 RepID=A0AAQ3R7G5_9PEZI|nr:Hypothetical protein R9X50_00072700 [Acrodontium crateriforme]
MCHRTSDRNLHSSPGLNMQWMTYVFLFGIAFLLCPGAMASDLYEAMELGYRGELIFDQSEPPVPPQVHLMRRQDVSSSVLSTSTALSTSAITTTSSTSSGSGLTTATSSSTNSLPTPFDTSLGNNFTASSCPQFFHTFLSNTIFQSCLPLSLLLETSSSFFQISHSLVQLTHTLDATCTVDLNQCSSVMASLATQIQSDAACGADFRLQNPTVRQAYNGFIAYEPLYHAGCLTDSSGNYCFSNAILNTSAPSSSYVYYLPLGVQLPGGTQPTCNTCLQNTMSVFAAAASNSTQPLSSDYGAAAQQIDVVCGPSFVQQSVKTNAATPISSSSGLGLSIAVAVAVLLF